MEKYNKKPASAIMLLENKAIKVENNGLTDFDSCTGEFENGLYSVKYWNKKNPDIFKKLFFPLEIKSVIDIINNSWIDNPILNRSGLAALIWDPEIEGKEINVLRRRLEDRAARGTFTDEEKSLILKHILDFVEQVQKSFNIRV
jgi:hypothetical protein